MKTRRDVLTKVGAGIAAILATGKAPAALVRSMVGAKYIGTGGELDFEPNFTTLLEFTTTASRTQAIIYSAIPRNPAVPIAIDWGDGTVDVVKGTISELTHTYATTGVHIVRLSDSIGSLRVSDGYNKIAAFTLTKILAIDPAVTMLPYCFGYIQNLASINLAGVIEIPANCFVMCNPVNRLDIPATVQKIGANGFNHIYRAGPVVFEASDSPLILGTSAMTYIGEYNAHLIDMSARRIDSIPNSCFQAAACTEVRLPNTVTSIGNSAFALTPILATLVCPCMQAPTAGKAWGWNAASYVGYRVTGEKKLIVPRGAKGYDTGTWASELLNPDICGFTLVEADF